MDEDVFGSSTGTSNEDLLPQLLGMFDELARRGEDSSCRDLQTGGACNIPVAIQKRLNLIPHSHRGSIFGQLVSSDTATIIVPSQLQKDSRMQGRQSLGRRQQEEEKKDETNDEDREEEENEVQTTGENKNSVNSNNDTGTRIENDIASYATLMIPGTNTKTRSEIANGKSIYRRKTNVASLRYSKRCSKRDIIGSRPLSGSSIASSTSSSGCSNQDNGNATNLYLTSVESLADTCASSQGSGDSGVITISEASCRVRDGDVRQRRNNLEIDSSIYHRPRYCDAHRNPVERVLLEIVDTEAIYVEHLRQVIQGYLISWRNDPAGLVQQLQLNDLFSNIEDIFEFNRAFLKEIETCCLDPICIANTFIKCNAGFKVYTEYCTNYPRTVCVLTDLMSHEVTANAFRERQAALGHALPLGSFLLKPVQRILKYHLLLENLSKEYAAGCEQNGKEAEGSNAIKEALEAMTGIAKHINAMKRRHEHAVRVQEIQSLLYGWPGPDLTTSGELVAEGRFRMRGAKAPRHAFLFERMLLLTKKKEDGLLVYKDHIMCSNLMLIESIPGEPSSFHVIPFNNPRLQYTLQARNVEQKREWALQIKRVILENYNAVIPSHARQLVLQLGQSQQNEDSPVDRGSTKKQYSAPPEYLEKRKQEKVRRRSSTGLRQKLKKNSGKSDDSKILTENSPASPRKKQSEVLSIINVSRDHSLNRLLDTRASKVKDRFANWRRKSEPGFQSYVSLSQSDDENKDTLQDDAALTLDEDFSKNVQNEDDSSEPNIEISLADTKDSNELHQMQEQQQPQKQVQTQTVEQIVGHILMQNQEFQRLLEKQRNNSAINVRHQQRFNKHVSVDTSDESDTDNANYPADLPDNIIKNNNKNNKDNRGLRSNHREQRVIRPNNTWNAFSLPQSRDVQPTLQLRYDNLRTETVKINPNETATKIKLNRVHEKRAIFEAFKRQSIVTDSKIIKTALRIRENTSNEENGVVVTARLGNNSSLDTSRPTNEKERASTIKIKTEECSKSFGNYDNLQHVWHGFSEVTHTDSDDSPTRPSVWLTKLSRDLPTLPQKAGSLPRSFQMNPNLSETITKTRFLQRDGKPINDRPFTIASDKPTEINMEDIERYASSCQPEGRIAKFPTAASSSSSMSSSSTFFLTLDDNITDAYSAIHASVTSTNLHPDHKIYRVNFGGGAILKNVFSKAGNKLQGLRATSSTETLESNEEFERTKNSRAVTNNTDIKAKKKKGFRLSRESSSDVEIDHSHVGCVTGNSGYSKIPTLYYKQGSTDLGARIAQSDYADPSFLFSESKRAELASVETQENARNVNEILESEKTTMTTTRTAASARRRESDTDSFYERSFETIENYVDADAGDGFRDSAIFSDADEIMAGRRPYVPSTDDVAQFSAKGKIAPPVPANRKLRTTLNDRNLISEESKLKPAIPQKSDNLKVRGKILLESRNETHVSRKIPIQDADKHRNLEVVRNDLKGEGNYDEKLKEQHRNDISAGQSQAGWVRKMVGQLQAHIET